MVFCSKCGAAISGGEFTCNKCGTKLDVAEITHWLVSEAERRSKDTSGFKRYRIWPMVFSVL